MKSMRSKLFSSSLASCIVSQILFGLGCGKAPVAHTQRDNIVPVMQVQDYPLTKIILDQNAVWVWRDDVTVSHMKQMGETVPKMIALGKRLTLDSKRQAVSSQKSQLGVQLGQATTDLKTAQDSRTTETDPSKQKVLDQQIANLFDKKLNIEARIGKVDTGLAQIDAGIAKINSALSAPDVIANPAGAAELLHQKTLTKISALFGIPDTVVIAPSTLSTAPAVYSPKIEIGNWDVDGSGHPHDYSTEDAHDSGNDPSIRDVSYVEHGGLLNFKVYTAEYGRFDFKLSRKGNPSETDTRVQFFSEVTQVLPSGQSRAGGAALNGQQATNAILPSRLR